MSTSEQAAISQDRSLKSVEPQLDVPSCNVEFLRSTAWDISERKPSEAFAPLVNHVALAMVHPCRGLAHWRISPEWIEETRKRRVDVWQHCRMVLRLYDVSYITFNGLNANRVQDQTLPCICGQMFFHLSHAGTWQLGEVGFLLRNGEFIPAARSHAVSFPRASASTYCSQNALLVDENMQTEPIGNLWDQHHILQQRRAPQHHDSSEEVAPPQEKQEKEEEHSLDYGQVKREINFGPMDRLCLFVGPLEHAAGVDILLEALPVLLQRVPNLRLAFAGAGGLWNGLHHRTRQLGVEYAVRFLGHVDHERVNRLMSASEALVLPSRCRVPFDDAVVDLARLAGRPVVTTHGGPASLVRHEETGIVTYDNPGSMVWALDRILGDPTNTRRMGENGRRRDHHAAHGNQVLRRHADAGAATITQ